MIPTHRERLRALSDDALQRVAELMNIPPAEFVIDELDKRNLCQADVVMALLQANLHDYVQELACVTIKHFERPWPRPLPRPPAKLPPGQWWVEWHERDLNLGGDEERNKIRIRCGMTVDDLVEAGVTRAQLLGAVRGGHLRMSGEPR